jgi:hypothetical protein
MLPFLLARAREWRVIADELRARGIREGDPVLTVWREAAWCHLLLTRGRFSTAVNHLRELLLSVTGEPPDPSLAPTSEADVLAVAADVFTRLRAFVAARFPAAFGRPAA